MEDIKDVIDTLKSLRYDMANFEVPIAEIFKAWEEYNPQHSPQEIETALRRAYTGALDKTIKYLESVQ